MFFNLYFRIINYFISFLFNRIKKKGFYYFFSLNIFFLTIGILRVLITLFGIILFQYHFICLNLIWTELVIFNIIVILIFLNNIFIIIFITINIIIIVIIIVIIYTIYIIIIIINNSIK
jgi:hypothetical protein